MPKLNLGHKPELTTDKLEQILQHEFGKKFEVYKATQRKFDFILKESDYMGVAFRVRQKNDKTYLGYSWTTPSMGLGLFLGWPLITNYFHRQELLQEVESFIENEPQLQPN